MDGLRDELSAERIAARLTTRQLGRWLALRSSVGSTMDALAELAEAGAPDGTVLVADHQTAGRGRLGRAWLAPPGTAVLMSVLFRLPGSLATRAAQVPLAMALGVVEGLAACLPAGVPLALKWPNDVLWQDRKLAGLLAEARGPAGGPVAVVVGLGLNVGQAPDALPDGAVSLASVVDRVPGRSALVAAVLNAAEPRYEALLAGADLVPDWSARLATLGRRVTAQGPDGPVTGLATGVSGDGALVLALDAGGQVLLRAGDVTLHGA
jgi:BirA family biotin operon repressor/biotin-[acetyl-CoA-carboxylase] ligase